MFPSVINFLLLLMNRNDGVTLPHFKFAALQDVSPVAFSKYPAHISVEVANGHRKHQ